MHNYRLPEDASKDQRSAFENSFVSMAKLSMDRSSGVQYCYGWGKMLFCGLTCSELNSAVHESLEDGTAPSGKALGFTGLMGWNSKNDFIRTWADAALKETRQHLDAVALPRADGETSLIQLHKG
jgi:hypothetical protein